MRAAFGEKDSRLADAFDDKAGVLEKAGHADEAKKLHDDANRVRTAAFAK
jgi:hypothetical protein